MLSQLGGIKIFQIASKKVLYHQLAAELLKGKIDNISSFFDKRKDAVTKTCEKSRPSRARGRSNYNKASKVFGVSVTSAHRDSIREMECTERALFIEIYCSLVSLAHFIILSLYFDFFKTHSILSLFRC